MTDVKRIESYGLFDFCKDIEVALAEGYNFDFETNENFPTAYGTMLTCGLVKAGKVEETEVEKTKVEETKTEAQTEQGTEIAQDEKQEEVKPEGSEQVPETKPEGNKRGPKAKNK